MDQFHFTKIFNCLIVANSKCRTNSFSKPCGHETKAISKTDKNRSDYAQEGKSEFNSSLQNPVKKRGRS
jgi:hypothetical protein